MKNKQHICIISLLVAAIFLSSTGCSGDKGNVIQSLLGEGTVAVTSAQTTSKPTSGEETKPTTTQTQQTDPIENPYEFDPDRANDYFATSLLEFSQNAEGVVRAMLYDIDGCGIEEMILVDEGVPDDTFEHWAVDAIGFDLAIYDAKYPDAGAGIFSPPYIIFSTYMVYITPEGYLVVSDVFEGESHYILHYEDGTITTENELHYGYDGADEYFGIGEEECTESEYERLFEKYDLGYIDECIGKGEMEESDVDITDHYNRILQRKSFAGSSSSEMQMSEDAYNALKPHLENMIYLYFEQGLWLDSDYLGTDALSNFTLDYIQQCASMLCHTIEVYEYFDDLESLGLYTGDVIIDGGVIHVPVSYIDKQMTDLFGQAALDRCKATPGKMMYEDTIVDGRYVCYLGDSGSIGYTIYPYGFPLTIDSDGSLELDITVEEFNWEAEDESDMWIFTDYVMILKLQEDSDSAFGYNVVSFTLEKA